MSVVTQIQLRRGTAASWTSANPTLASGEFGFETDTGKAKIGNGSTAWNSLAYSITGTDGDITGVTAGTGLSGGGTSGTVTVSIDTSVTADLSTAQTLTNKTISGASNTISNIGNSSLTNSAITINGTSVSLGGSVSVGDITGVTASTGLSGGGTSGDVTLSIDNTVTTLTGTQTLTNKTLTDAKINLGIDPETASYTAVLANNSQIVTMNNASANTFSIPTDASVDFPIGSQITVLQIGAGQTTIQAVTAGTTTINSTGATANAPKLRVRYSSATCVKLSANNWVVLGDIS
jgi:hypothetical protein